MPTKTRNKKLYLMIQMHPKACIDGWSCEISDDALFSTTNRQAMINIEPKLKLFLHEHQTSCKDCGHWGMGGNYLSVSVVITETFIITLTDPCLRDF